VKLSLELARRDAGAKVQREGHCRMCLRPAYVRPLTRHHLVPSRWFVRSTDLRLRMIRNASANVVPLCRPCHDLIETSETAVRMEARTMLRRVLTQQEVTFCIQVRGQQWLEWAYPSSSGSRTPTSVRTSDPPSRPSPRITPAPKGIATLPRASRL
jgi:hypothetical protein